LGSLFTNWTDWVHFALGTLSSLGTLSKRTAPLSLVTFAVFTEYELVQPEETLNKVGDFVEYLMGFALGTLLSMSRPSR
jgi:hypothetical protein